MLAAEKEAASMNIRALATNGRTPACWDKPNLFAAHTLDYDPSDEAYESLDLLGHTILAAAKVAAEEAAVDVCFGCPLMLACETMDAEYSADPSNSFIPGVIGGRTEAERKGRRTGRTTPAAKAMSAPNPQIAPGDRGPRNQVDDELIARLTHAGKTSEQIARELNCSPRTVTRARKRMNLSAAQPVSASPVESGVEDQATTASPLHEISTTAQTIARNETATQTAHTHAARTHAARTHTTRTHTTTPPAPSSSPCLSNPFIGGRPVSAPMEAIYNHLAMAGGTDHIERLLTVGIPHVEAAEAIDWWTKHNSVTDANGNKTLRSSKAHTPMEDRIREGARAKVFNAVSATHRKGRYLDRDGDMYTFKQSALTAWQQRMDALTLTAA